MKGKRIVVLTGGPSTGKTTLINELNRSGHTCFNEISREIIEEARKEGIDQLFLENPLLFSELLLKGRIKQHHEACQTEADLIFLDRGVPDVLAYMHYIGDSYPQHFHQSCQDLRYDTVFLLPPWQEIYTSDEQRYENYEQSVLIYNHLKETYTSFGYNIIEVPFDTVDKRIVFILEKLKELDKNED